MEDEYKKFASKMRDDLYRKLKLLSAAEDKSIQDLLEEAVGNYLGYRRFSEEPSGLAGVKEDGARYSVSFDISKDKKDKKKK